MTTYGKRRRRRCGGCSALFWPDPRVGAGQRYCSNESCQRARKREYQRQWRASHPAEERGRRLREALAAPDRTRGPPRPAEPLALIPWDEIGNELGPATGVVLMCALGVVVRWLARPGGGQGGALADGDSA